MLTYTLHRKAEKSLYEQLYQALRFDIEQGILTSGERLPSKRALARHLGVSVVTVEGAYDQLLSEGYVRSVPRSGFYVQKIGRGSSRFCGCGADGVEAVGQNGVFGRQNCGCCAETGMQGIRSGRVNEPAASQESFSGSKDAVRHTEWLADFTGATAPEGLFPYAGWARTLRRVLADESERTVLEAAGPQGSPRLRAAIAAHLRGFRGMDVHPDQIVVGSGAQSLYGLLVQLLGRGLVYGVEDPGYPRLARIYRSNDVRVATVPVDDAGPLPTALREAGVDVLHCMPSHQFPLGTTTPVGRRWELLAWARGDEQDAGGRRYLIEDDFDCEFRMTGRPVPSLAALDGAGRVVYANTFTKTLGAAFRIGYVVLPWELAARFRDQLGFYACTVGALEQLTLARFMESGDYERHVNRQRTYFRRVQNALVEALGASEAAGFLRLRNVGAGLHFLMEVLGVPAANAAACERAIAERAAAAGVRLAPLGDYCAKDAASAPAFVMSFASLAEEQASEVAAVIAAAVRGVLSR